MSYPGNASLAPDIQTRILDTFRQTLSLVESDSLNEAKLGCDFILRLDPMFEPARWLQDRLDSAEGGIHLDDLREVIADFDVNAAAKAASPSPAPGGAGDLIPDPVASAPAAPATEAGDLSPDPIAASPPPAQPSGSGDLIPDPIQPTPETPAAVPQAEAIADETPAAAAPAAETPAESDPEGAAEAEPQAVTQAAAFADADEPVPASAEEVMDAPVAALDTESEKRVQDLLAEGQTALDSGEYQTAIDSWSRIFLIDIDHPEANERIEQARKLKAEAERSVEEAFHEALAEYDRGSIDEARAGLEKVLEMQPDHLAAREQLERLDSPEAAAAPPPTPSATPPAGEDELLSEPALDASDLEEPALGLDLEQLTAPEGGLAEDQAIGPPGAVPIPKPRRKAPAAKGDRSKLLLYVGAAIVLLVLVGGWLLSSNWSKMFPNASEQAAAQADRPDAIERAEALHAEGKTSTALAQLKRLPPQHERYSEAQALIAQWEAAEAQAADEGVTEAELAEFDSLLAQASEARSRREYLRVEELLDRAAAIQLLDEDTTALRAAAKGELEPIRSQVAIFKQGEWEVALGDLWRIRDRMPDNPDVNRLMVDSYYNLGVRALQRGDTGTAAEHFGEGLRLASGDLELQRLSRFSQTYKDRPEDLLYRIFVKYLPFR